MGDKRFVPQFEESTKIHSSEELGEMLRQVKSAPPLDDAHDEFESDEHTMIGNSQELAARSMAIPDVEPSPAIEPKTKNIVRRTGPHVVARASGVVPIVRAVGSANDIPTTSAVPEDDAFVPWDGESSSQLAVDPFTVEAPTAETIIEAPIAEPMTAEPTTVEPMTAEPMTAEPMTAEPMIEAPVQPAIAVDTIGAACIPDPGYPEFGAPVMTATPQPRMRRSHAIVGVLMLLTISAGGTLGFLRMTQLEDRAAIAERETESARAAIEQLARDLAAARAALDAANARLEKR